MSIRSSLTWIGGVVGIGALCFVLFRAVEHKNDIPTIPLTVRALSSLAAAVVLSALPVAFVAVAMSSLLRDVGEPLSWRRSFTLVGRSQIGKYLPGNVFQYVGRVAMGARDGVPATPLALAVGTETLLTVAVAIVIAGAGWLVDGRPTDLDLGVLNNAFLFWISMGLGVFLVSGLLATLVRRDMGDWRRKLRIKYTLATLLTVLTLYSVAFISIGLVLVVLVRGVLGIESSWGWAQFTWRFALIWALGLATIGAPAGLGVREALMLVWFSPVLSESVAIGLAALLRLVTTVADVVVFSLAVVLKTDGRGTA